MSSSEYDNRATCARTYSKTEKVKISTQSRCKIQKGIRRSLDRVVVMVRALEGRKVRTTVVVEDVQSILDAQSRVERDKDGRRIENAK